MRVVGTPAERLLAILLSPQFDTAMRRDQKDGLELHAVPMMMQTDVDVKMMISKQITPEDDSMNAADEDEGGTVPVLEQPLFCVEGPFLSVLEGVLCLLPIVQLLCALGHAPLHFTAEKDELRKLLEMGLEEIASSTLTNAPPLDMFGAAGRLQLVSEKYDFTCDGTPHSVYLLTPLPSTVSTDDGWMKEVHDEFTVICERFISLMEGSAEIAKEDRSSIRP